MHKLEEKILNWRKQMAAGGLKSPAVLDELESHLREDVEHELKSGSGDAKAFEAATRRIGQSSLLKEEFAKVNRFKWSRPAQIIGIALCVLAAAFAFCATPSLLTIREMTLGQRLLGLAAVAVTFFAIASWRFSHKYLPAISNRRLRMVAGAACSLAGVVWLYAFGGVLLYVIVPQVLGGLRTTPTENFYPAFAIGISFLWAIALAAILGSIAYGLEEAARRANRRVSN
jgi:hypothetical protein